MLGIVSYSKEIVCLYFLFIQIDLIESINSLHVFFYSLDYHFEQPGQNCKKGQIKKQRSTWFTTCTC